MPDVTRRMVFVPSVLSSGLEHWLAPTLLPGHRSCPALDLTVFSVGCGLRRVPNLWPGQARHCRFDLSGRVSPSYRIDCRLGAFIREPCQARHASVSGGQATAGDCFAESRSGNETRSRWRWSRQACPASGLLRLPDFCSPLRSCTAPSAPHLYLAVAFKPVVRGDQLCGPVEAGGLIHSGQVPFGINFPGAKQPLRAASRLPAASSMPDGNLFGILS
jgi:hypothetical protein